MVDVLEELQWRGLIAQHSDIDELRKALNEEKISFYCGFDPTAASLHHGHLVAVKMMRHLQMAGHRPIVLVGGATGLIGDPRPKGERSLNTRETVAQWTQSLRDQLESLLDFDGENAAITVNNLDWTQSMSAIDFLRDLGKHFRMGTMLSKDIVARRLQSDEGIFHRILLPDPASKRLPRIVPPVQLHVGAGGQRSMGQHRWWYGTYSQGGRQERSCSDEPAHYQV